MDDLLQEARQSEEPQKTADSPDKGLINCPNCKSENIFGQVPEDPHFYHCFNCGAKTLPIEEPIAEPIKVQDAFAKTAVNIWYSTIMRPAAQIAFKGDLSPISDEQRNILADALKPMAEKYLPSFILGMQEEFGFFGMSLEVGRANFKKPEQKKDGEQDNSNTGA